MKVIIHYKDGRIETHNKMTEVHYNYGNRTHETKNKIAFESNKMCFGFTEDISNIAEIEVYEEEDKD